MQGLYEQVGLTHAYALAPNDTYVKLPLLFEISINNK